MSEAWHNLNPERRNRFRECNKERYMCRPAYSKKVNNRKELNSLGLNKACNSWDLYKLILQGECSIEGLCRGCNSRALGKYLVCNR